jgi:signal transduction histidine kinase
MITSNAGHRPAENPIKILHLEDSPIDHALACRALERSGMQFRIERVETLSDFEQSTRSNPPDVILADYKLPGFTALDAWADLPTERPPFVLLSGAIGEAAAVSAIHSGISDYVSKEDIDTLGRVILRALDIHRAVAAKNRADMELAASEKRLAEFAEHLQTTIEGERAAIAREIHDDIGGSLTAVNLDLAWISRHSEDQAIQAHLKAATTMLQQAMDASQRIMMNMRPSILDQGLLAAIEWLAISFERRTGIKTTLRTSSAMLDPPKPVQLVAYRTAQEALTNISKHAECNLVRLDLSDADGVLTVEIVDNGRGITKEQLEKPRAFGLRGLHERAKAVGGWLDISSREGNGASIILTVPLTHAKFSQAEESHS